MRREEDDDNVGDIEESAARGDLGEDLVLPSEETER